MPARRLRANLWQLPTDFLVTLLERLRILVASASPAGVPAAVMFGVVKVELRRRGGTAPFTPIADGPTA